MRDLIQHLRDFGFWKRFMNLRSREHDTIVEYANGDQGLIHTKLSEVIPRLEEVNRITVFVKRRRPGSMHWERRDTIEVEFVMCSPD